MLFGVVVFESLIEFFLPLNTEEYLLSKNVFELR